MGDLIKFPTKEIQFEKFFNDIIDTHYSNKSYNANKIQIAKNEILEIVKTLNTNKPLFEISLVNPDIETLKKETKRSVQKMSKQYASIISSLLVMLFKEKIKQIT